MIEAARLREVNLAKARVAQKVQAVTRAERRKAEARAVIVGDLVRAEIATERLREAEAASARDEWKTQRLVELRGQGKTMAQAFAIIDEEENKS